MEIHLRLQKFLHNAVKFLVVSLVNVVFAIWKLFQPTMDKILFSNYFKKELS